MENFSITEQYILKNGLTKNSFVGEEGAEGISVHRFRFKATRAAHDPARLGRAPTRTWGLSALGWIGSSVTAGVAPSCPVSDGLAGPTSASTVPNSVPERHATP